MPHPPQMLRQLRLPKALALSPKKLRSEASQRGDKSRTAGCAAHVKEINLRQMLTVDLFQQIILEHDERLNSWWNGGASL